MPKKRAPQKDLVVEAILKMSNKIDGLDSRLDSMDKTLVKQEANLDEHMRRTELAEAAIGSIRQEIEPIKKHVIYLEGALKGVGVIATLVSVAAGLVKIFSFFSSL